MHMTLKELVKIVDTIQKQVEMLEFIEKQHGSAKRVPSVLFNRSIICT